MLLATVALAGCAAPDAVLEASGSPGLDAPPPAPFVAEGLTFLPPSQGEARETTEIPFYVNATGMTGDIVMRLGGRYVVELPPLLADVEVEVRGPAGDVIGGARLGASSSEATIALADLARGDHALVLLSYGGSDGRANGDYVAWRIAVA